MCCRMDEDSSINDDEETALLEKTISDLTDDGELKNKYITKLKEEYKLFMQEALKTEEELYDLIKNQEKIIKELSEEINILKKNNLLSIKTKKTIGTQTTKTTKDMYTTMDTKTCHSEIKKKSQAQENMNKINIQDEPKRKQINDLKNKYTHINPHMSVLKNKNTNESKKKNKILILADDMGVGINKALCKYKELDGYTKLSFVKPGAKLNEILANIEDLTKDFTIEDFVITMAGTNDIISGQTPSFRYICNKLKLCTHTNILFASVPYQKTIRENKHIFKYNSNLNKFLWKFNKYTEGHVHYIEINPKAGKPTASSAALQLKNYMCRANFITKNLHFIRPTHSPTDIVNIEIASARTTNNNSDTNEASFSLREELNADSRKNFRKECSLVLIV